MDETKPRRVEEGSEVTEGSLDELLKLLAERRCRYALYCLEDADDAVFTLDEFAERIMALERDWGDPEAPCSTADHRTVTIELHHDHLPRLSAAGVIDYDARSRTIRNRCHSSITEWIDDHADELTRLRALLAPSEA
jgi:hypothetical protein